MDEIQKILNSDDPGALRSFFAFTIRDEDGVILLKFNLWGRKYFPKYFKASDAPAHKRIDLHNLQSYRGTIKSFTDVGYRGLAKSTRTKLFVSFCIANDMEHFRKYIKFLAEDDTNSKQYVTDIYNMFMDHEIAVLYPEVFQKTEFKREEKMDSFTTATGIKALADTVGTGQRGQLAEDARPDWIIFDDFENRKTLRSAVITKAIFDNMEEARNGLAINGSSIYNCNYISERGNVHKLIGKADTRNVVLMTPIKVMKDGAWAPTWPAAYTMAMIDQIENDVEDFHGEYMNTPSASGDTFFDRETILNLVPGTVERDIAGFKIYKKYDASHRYALGADIAGGVGLDSSTSVIIDFDTIPARVVATYKSNTIKPDTFAYELKAQGDRYGGCLVAPEVNNHGHATIAILKGIYDNIYTRKKADDKLPEVQQPKEYGWHTNVATKNLMLFAAKKAVEDNLVQPVDPDLIAELKSFSRDDLMDKVADPRLTTRHFDLLTAFAIAWQMLTHAEVAAAPYVEEEEPPQFPEIGL